MRVEKIMATIVLLAIGLLNGYGFALAADAANTATELDKLQEQVRVLDKDLALLKEISAAKLDAQDKRISDIGLATAQQSNHLSAISNQTTSVGNYVAWTSGVITLLVLAAGFITFFSATRRVKEESREWFEKNTSRLHTEIEALRVKVQAASGEIDGHKEQVAISSKAALANVESGKNSFDAAAGEILQSMQPADLGSTAAIDPESSAVVDRASDELKAKPELSFTAENHYARGLSYLARGNHHSALESFKAASRAFPEPTAPDRLVGYLFAQAIALGALGKSEEAIAVYDEMDSRFGKISSPGVREQVIRGLFNKGVRFGALGDLEQEIAVYESIEGRFGNDDSPRVRELVVTALFNRGVKLGALDRTEEELAAYGAIESRFGKDESPSIRALVATALCNKGVSLAALARTEEELAVYEAIEGRFGKDESPGLRAPVATALRNKAVRFGALGRSEEAIAIYDAIDRRFGNDELTQVREQVARGLINKGLTLSALGKSEEAIGVYGAMESRFGNDDSPGVREQMGKARNGAAFWRILSAKQHWQDGSRKAELLATAIKGLESALLICQDDDRAMMLGNLGYALLLSGNSAAATEPTRECLRLGGEKSLAAQRGDTQQHRVEPEDTHYEALLAAAWAELHPAKELVVSDS
jgi:tetratricopeptide (TPR) repeat protein